jgi:hypothetical protein
MSSYSDSDLVEGLQRWADTDAPSTFDDAFIGSMAEALDKWDSLTETQRGALERIAERFHVDIGRYLNRV